MKEVERIRALIKQIEQDEPCTCVACGECGGSGNVWYEFGGGRYLGGSRSDDMDEMESCESCGGSGIVEHCGRCEYLADLDMELEDAEQELTEEEKEP